MTKPHGNSIPCCGFPSRTAAVMALKAQGLKHRQIAERTRLPITTVSALLHSGGRRIALRRQDAEVRRLLLPFAKARGIPVAEMKRRILAATAFGGMVDAVLDDEGGGAC